jgi:hypothetical protein
MRTPKKPFQIALLPEVQKKIRRLAVEFDTYPGDAIKGLLDFAEMVRAVKGEQVSKQTIETLFNACMGLPEDVDGKAFFEVEMEAEKRKES